jgi:hypothetical protein
MTIFKTVTDSGVDPRSETFFGWESGESLFWNKRDKKDSTFSINS